MTIDTEIRHVTKAGANLFLDLGFSAAEAEKPRRESPVVSVQRWCDSVARRRQS